MNRFCDTVALFAAIAYSHRLLGELARAVGKSPCAVGITHWFDVYEDGSEAGFRLEEYISAELVDGGAFDWCLEIRAGTLSNQLEIIADVRRYSSAGVEIVEPVLHYTSADIAEAAVILRSKIADLCAVPVNR